jgi:hypothetical protein
MAIHVKGVGFDSAMRFAERESGEQAVQQVLDALGRQQNISYPEQRLPSSLVPLPLAAAAWTAVYELASSKTKEPSRSYFQRMGRFVAIANLSGVYRGLLQSLGSPTMLAKRTAMMWQTYFPGAVVECDNATIKDGRHEFVVYGFEGVPFIGAIAEGWNFYTFDLVGARDLVVIEAATERGDFAADGPLRYAIRWRI